MPAPKVTKNNVEQTIDLEEMFGVDFKGLRAARQAIGQAVIDKIIERVDAKKGIQFDEKGRGREYNLNSVPYSESYKKSLAFKAAGKNPKSVTLKLMGDMLDQIDVIKETGNTITIGWAEKLQKKKAYAHTVGNDGDKSVNVPARPFFGVSKSELNEIAREFRQEIKEIIKAREDEGIRAAQQMALELLDEVEDV